MNDSMQILRSAWGTPAPTGVRSKLLIVAYIFTGWQWLRPAMRWSGKRDRKAST